MSRILYPHNDRSIILPKQASAIKFPLINILGPSGTAPPFDPITQLSPLVLWDFTDDTTWYNAYANTGPDDTVVRPFITNTADSQVIGTVMNKADFDSFDTGDNLISGLTPVLSTTFDSATGWTLGANWSITGGVLQGSGSGGASEATYNISATDGTYYLVQAEVSAFTGGRFAISIGNTASDGVYGTMSGTGTYEVIVKADGTGEINITTDATDFQGDITSLTVYELPGGAHAFTLTGNRPVAGTDGSSNRYLGFSLDWLSTVGDDLTFGSSGLNIAVMHQPSAGVQGTYAGLCCMSQRSATVHSFNMMGDNVSSVWDPSLWMTDPLTEEWNRNSTSSSLECQEYHYNETAGTWEVFSNGSSESSGSESNSYVVSGSLGRIVCGADGNRNTTFDYVGNIYMVVIYAGARNSSLFGWMNEQIGSPL